MVFTSFTQVANYLVASGAELEKSRVIALKMAGAYLQEKLKSKYGVQQPWRPPTTSPTPLLKTGALRNSVQLVVSGTSATVFSTMARLALIHEYWVTYKMTDKQRKFLFANVFTDAGQGYVAKNPWMITIPARPIRRNILTEETVNIRNIISQYLAVFN